MPLNPARFFPTAALVLLVALAAACGDSASDETDAMVSSAIPNAEETGETMPTEFAPALNVDLDQMERQTSGLHTRDLEIGDGAFATPGDRVSVHYTGWLPDGTQFDSSRGSSPFQFQLGAGMVIAGWDEGVAGMRVGGRRQLVIPPALAYGAAGFPGAIPPNSTLVFDVELLDVP